MSGEAATESSRPLLAIVTGHLPPYREHFHRRIAREMPEVRLATLVTKFRSGPWVNPSVPEIGTVMFEPKNVEPKGLVAKGLHERRKGAAVMRWLEKHRPAAVLIIGYDEIPNLCALRWGRRRGVPVMMWADSNVRGDLATGLKRAVKKVYVPWVCRKLSRVLVCGSGGEAFFGRYGVPLAKMSRVPVEPDYSLIQEMSAERIRLLGAEAGLEESGRRRIVCCCRLIEAKRVDLVIDAFAGIAGERPEWELLIAGDGPLRGELEQRVPESLRAANRVRFLGFLDQEHVTAVYRASDVLVLASDYEPWALVVNEALAAGCAVVASNVVGAAAELVRENVNGAVFASGDLRALIESLRKTTAGGEIDRLKRGSAAVLAEWRRGADPIDGVRRALGAVGAETSLKERFLP